MQLNYGTYLIRHLPGTTLKCGPIPKLGSFELHCCSNDHLVLLSFCAFYVPVQFFKSLIALHMVEFLRRLVSGGKARFKDLNLDLELGMLYHVLH